MSSWEGTDTFQSLARILWEVHQAGFKRPFSCIDRARLPWSAAREPFTPDAAGIQCPLGAALYVGPVGEEYSGVLSKRAGWDDDRQPGRSSGDCQPARELERISHRATLSWLSFAWCPTVPLDRRVRPWVGILYLQERALINPQKLDRCASNELICAGYLTLLQSIAVMYQFYL